MTETLLRASLYTMALNLGFAIVAMLVGTLAIKAIDHLFFPQINFAEELKKGNIAVAIVIGMAILFFGLVLSNAVR
jgi:cytochrome c biogenesis protein CcdA